MITMMPIKTSLSTAELAYQAFKYAIYSLLIVNFFLFLAENIEASEYTFASGLSVIEYFEAFSDSIDTAAWVLLLLLFELETYIIDDTKLTFRVKATLMSIRSLCYLFIFSSLYGYFSRYFSVLQTTPFDMSDICTLVGSHFTHIVSLNDYVPIDMESCRALNQATLIQLTNTDIIGSVETYNNIRNLALIDVINASTWLLIVVVLEVDVYMQSVQKYKGALFTISKWMKAALYMTLLICATIWWFKGDFLDFWDAFLWLIAFVFIEMNLFEWQREKVAAKQANV